MTATTPILGYDIPAEIGMAEADILTPALVIDLDVFERNVDQLATCIQIVLCHGI